jgi:hypothetical protein
MGRTLLLRFFGFVTTLAVGIAAVALITFGIDRSIRWLNAALSDVASWAVRTPEEGAAILGGLALVIVAALCIPVAIQWKGRRLLRLDSATAGATSIDLDSVANVLKRTVTGEVDSQIEVRHRRGRILVTTPISPDDTYKIADETSKAIDQRLEALGLSEVAYSVATGRKQARRAR